MKSITPALLAVTAITVLSPQALPAQTLLDRDGDGHSDIWQLLHGIPSANGDDDSDGDGVSDRAEETAGTNPWSADSKFGLPGLKFVQDVRGNPMVRLEFDGMAGKSYQFQGSAGLTADFWRDLGTAFAPAAAGPAAVELPVEEGAARGFFRAIVTDTDQDRDGLTAFEETVIGTSDLTPNSAGTAGPADADAARTWADGRDPGRNPREPQANLREVDVAFIRSGNAATGAGTELVTAVGTGGWHQLTSWRAAGGASSAPLASTPPVDGHHPKVHLLAPALQAAAPKFVTGRIRANGDLWLSSRALAPGSGAFIHHKSIGYGSNAGVEVLEYDMAHRTFSTRTDGVTHYHVVTAVVVKPTGGTARSVRVITWRVNAVTGALTGLKDSGNLLGTDLAEKPALRIAHLSGKQFEITYTSANGNLAHHPVWTEDDGSANGSYALDKAFDIRGTELTPLPQQANAVAGLTSSGYTTAIRKPDGSLQMAVWDRRPDRVVPFKFDAHFITDETTDQTPDLAGVALPAPVLTDSFASTLQAGALLGGAVAIGDFNGDGFVDIAIGTPAHESGAGAVYILHGSAEGMTNKEYQQVWMQGLDGIAGAAEGGDGFGRSLAAGDFNGDGNDDLAVGAPQEAVGNTNGAGAVNVLYGTPFGLGAAGNQLITQETLGHPLFLNGNFSWSLTTGDFNGDGKSDLAVSVPNVTVSGQAEAGAVHVLWGAAAALSFSGSHYIHQDSPAMPGQAEEEDKFGGALTTGDFNGDGEADLAVGIPFEDIGNREDAGSAQIIYGQAANGFGNSVLISRDGFETGEDILGTAAAGDMFGYSLAAGDFDKDGADDLALGIPGDDAGGLDSGAVHVLYGTFLGLTWFSEQLITQSQIVPAGGALPGQPGAGNNFGWAVAASDTNGDGFQDLLAGAPGEDLANKPDAGAFMLIPGAATGLSGTGSLRIHQDSGKKQDGDNSYAVDGSASASGRFGSCLAGGGDFNADGEEDLVIGNPFRDNGDDADCGAAQIMHGSAEYAVTYQTDIEWFAQIRRRVMGAVTDVTRENAGGKGAGKLFGHNDFLDATHVASSTKTMTLLLAVEAIEAGLASLDDLVTASELAGTTGGSKLGTYDAQGKGQVDENGKEIPFIQTGDTMPLRLLLAGMMNESCNRSSVAIGQHIALKVKNNQHEFVNMMNARALDLKLTESLFGHPAGGWVTKPQDLITLQIEGIRHPLFVQFSSLETYGDQQPEEVLCGTDIMENAKCNGPFPQIMSMGEYPGRLSWKGGNGGLWFNSDQANDVPARPVAAWCTTSRVGTSRRLDRTLAIGLQQTGGGANDVQNLLDYGYRRLFTPDASGTRSFPEGGGLVGPEGPVRVRNFAIDAWDGKQGVTAVIDDHEELRLNIWTLDYDKQQVVSAGNVSKTYNLISGISWQEPALVDLAAVPTDEAIADFLSANLTGEHLELKIWRLGRNP